MRVRIWANVRPMGWLGLHNGAYYFEYDPQWLQFEGGYELSPRLPMLQQRHEGDAVRIFFENLLPEGETLTNVLEAIQMGKASTFEIMARLGRELPGVLSLLPEGESPSAAQQYTPLEPAELNRRIAETAAKPLLVSGQHTTMSIPGAQEKLGVRYDPKKGTLSDCVEGAPSTHILKPDIRTPKYSPSAINEYACMQLAAAMKLPVPKTDLIRVPAAAYIVERYDRKNIDGNILGIHQVDGCQLLNIGPGWKYQRGAGLASLPLLAKAMDACRISGADRLLFARWVMFNYLIGNSDAHAKNISLLVTPRGYQIAPFYDLLCVRAYGDDTLALFIGDEETFDEVGRQSWEAFCDDCGFDAQYMLPQLAKMAQMLLPTWAKVLDRVVRQSQPTYEEHELLAKMTDIFAKHTQYVRSMLGG